MQFGGAWTEEKLGILERYLDAYTTALKSTPFKLVYIDAFAGTGLIDLQEDRDAVGFRGGSTRRAIQIRDKPFDELVFIEKDPARCAHLEKLRDEYPGRRITVENSEANSSLCDLRKDWRTWRGVLFLDPFATEVEWSTIKAIADFQALDTWILFPVSAIVRMLPRSRKPDDISPGWVSRLTRVFGDQSWRELYTQSPQRNLFGDSGSERQSGVDGLVSIYKKNLERLFGQRFLSTSRRLKTSTGSPLFEFMFCVGNPRGIGPATRIAGHILDRM
ncbi:MAG: three-Cys-motif partner protein TcmP [Acidobacteria bacterium]|nr:three-Cys-motif partner protein TcmP [Acidobacteriota bacterium]